MRKVFASLCVIFILFTLLFVLKPQQAHADCQNLGVVPVNVRADYTGQITFININGCFNPSLTYDVFGWPQSDKSSAPVPGYVEDDSVNASSKSQLVVSFDLISAGADQFPGIWNLWICTDNGINGYDCGNGLVGKTTILVDKAAQPEPIIYSGSMQQCSFPAASSVPITINNLIGNISYYMFWEDECGVFGCPHKLDWTEPAPAGDPNAPITEVKTLPGDATHNTGDRWLCVDGFGQTRTDHNKNCVLLHFYGGNPPPNAPKCSGPTVPPTPPPPINCAIKYNGVCGGSSSQGFSCPNGYKPNPNGDTGGCGGTSNPNAICCVPNNCAKVGEACGVAQGSAYCCDSKDICKITSRPDQEPPTGVCTGCGSAGDKCNSQQLCCFPGFVCVGDTGLKDGTCATCVQEGNTGCSAKSPCCTTSDSCTNGGKCVASCSEGSTCTGNGDCCNGQTCSNGGCHTPSPTPTTLVPSFPPVNWCDSTKKSCNTALGDWSFVPADFIKTLFAIVLSLAGGITVLTIIYAGYVYMSSQGNPERVQHAQELLTAAIVGLLFTMFSLVILQTIGVDLLHLPGFNP